MILTTLLLNMVFATVIKVAVLDTGYDVSKLDKLPLCENKMRVSQDHHNHGKNIVSLIKRHAGPVGYCFYIYKVLPGPATLTVAAIKDAIARNVKVINYSGGSLGGYNQEEQYHIKKFLDQGGIFIAASGNDGVNLRRNACSFYPACLDPRIIVIGNFGNSSNYGSVVDHVVNGNNIVVDGFESSGSSLSAAIFTGLYVRSLVFNNKLNNN